MRPRYGFLAGVIFGGLLSAFAAGGIGGLAAAPRQERDSPASQDNQELARLYEQDQADRSPQEGRSIAWEAVGRRDRGREARVKALYGASEVRTGKDYHRAAMVLQHAPRPEDYLLAHELCVVALAKGERGACWLAAAAEDRFLMTIGRPQRFGTQYRSSGPDEPVRLYGVGPGVTDELRREMGVPSLAQARVREAEIQKLGPGKRPSPTP
jgi:hypothetical protein